MTTLTNIEIWSGDTRTLTFTARDYNNAVLDLTDASIQWKVGRGPGGIALIQKTGAIINPSAGTFSVSLANGDTNTLPQRDYFHEATVTVDGSIITAVRGRFRVYQVVSPMVAS